MLVILESERRRRRKRGRMEESWMFGIAGIREEGEEISRNFV